MNSALHCRASILASITLGLIAMVSPVPCHAEDALAAAKHRQVVMDRLGDDIKAIKAYLTDPTKRDAATAAAQDLEATSIMVPGLFPKGSDSKALPGKSAAKPEIWDNPDDFQQLGKTLALGATDLRKAVATGDLAKTRESLRSVAKNACGACHENYRGRKDGD